jgi:hypothetical protein
MLFCVFKMYLLSVYRVFNDLYLLSCMLSDRMGFIDWPWQYDWCQQVAWEMVNFSIIGGVAIICRPTDTSNLLSYASQLPMEDPGMFFLALSCLFFCVYVCCF